MGCSASKRYAELYYSSESRVLRARMLALEGEIREMRRRRLQEARAHKRQLAVLARRHEEVASALEKRLVVEEVRRRALEAAAAGVERAKKELRWLGARRLAERMAKEQQARRDQVAERWKQLYLAIKAELDALIIRLKEGERLCWIAGGDVIGRLRIELKAKEDTIERLTSSLEATEKEKAESDRQMDIMKQSLRNLDRKKRRNTACRRNLPRILQPQR